MPDRWEQHGDHWTFAEMSAKRAPDDNAFVILSFGDHPDADRALSAIQAALPFGKIRLRVTPHTKSTIDQLTGDGRIKCVRTVGTEQEEMGVMGVRRV